ncbi:MAG: class I SAM-dependent methyltransferase [Oceanospirillaceae bacterium]|jgi:16S rRNA (guanine1207-N2)-methyltransferase|nr:class I SAM-dependent methyltransferase [Oceanospirillaceae bacterium]MBT4442173.1 class I SAM-dependent methyltransferase [Oceanospirillaceae bacterium]MBT6076874.1 class I SAM-dependent methyltransferase [Oceanospirillaceae bacterium]MBT7330787.1 class I SAM-dependent methyltransferase [Oceanospirillaceae bacterium]
MMPKNAISSPPSGMASHFGKLNVYRLPLSSKQTLLAFDQGDLLALDYIHEQQLLQPHSRVLVVNDAFAAVTCGLTEAVKMLTGGVPTLWSDSHIAQQALAHNAQHNGLALADFVPAHKTPQGAFDLMVLKLPKSHRLLKDQVARLLPQLAAGAVIIMPVMVKHLDTPLFVLLESLLGPLTTSLARKKARLVLAAKVEAGDGESPPAQTHRWSVAGLGLTLDHYSGVFSPTKLDQGAQVLLENFPDGNYQHIIDLGCGNGVQAIMAAKKWPQSQVTGVDESCMAVASATNNALANGVGSQCRFITNDCLTDMDPQSADLILCNPPFHQERVMGDQIAMRMFAQAAQVLSADGELWVVGNRHLGYHAKLKRWFKQVQQIGSHPKFVVLKARL